ncbi:SCO3933 family regulatory protein [Actinomadura litoris]|uniref:SCO3933 family regulatory protein n=1 Tax=Actinomadura litoris TaxID=2678616 RepID=UPI001FA6C31E|nr:hypothetical protein [Actinomadura litoris]
MRSIPVDLSALTFICVSAPRPKLVSQETGEVKVDRDGKTVFTVGLSAADATGRVDLVNVSVPGDQEVSIGQIVTPVGLVAFPWDQVIGGQQRWGIAYRASRIELAAPVSAPESSAASVAADVA